jgi:hypothetical protein
MWVQTKCRVQTKFEFFFGVFEFFGVFFFEIYVKIGVQVGFRVQTSVFVILLLVRYLVIRVQTKFQFKELYANFFILKYISYILVL